MAMDFDTIHLNQFFQKTVYMLYFPTKKIPYQKCYLVFSEMKTKIKKQAKAERVNVFTSDGPMCIGYLSDENFPKRKTFEYALLL